MGDVKGDALVIAMYHNLAEVEAEKGGHTFCHVQTETSTNTLADGLAEVKARH